MKYVYIATLETEDEGDEIIDVCSTLELAKKACEGYYWHHNITWTESPDNDYWGEIQIDGIGVSKQSKYHVAKWELVTDVNQIYVESAE